MRFAWAHRRSTSTLLWGGLVVLAWLAVATLLGSSDASASEFAHPASAQTASAKSPDSAHKPGAAAHKSNADAHKSSAKSHKSKANAHQPAKTTASRGTNAHAPQSANAPQDARSGQKANHRADRVDKPGAHAQATNPTAQAAKTKPQPHAADRPAAKATASAHDHGTPRGNAFGHEKTFGHAKKTTPAGKQQSAASVRAHGTPPTATAASAAVLSAAVVPPAPVAVAALTAQATDRGPHNTASDTRSDESAPDASDFDAPVNGQAPERAATSGSAPAFAQVAADVGTGTPTVTDMQLAAVNHPDHHPLAGPSASADCAPD